MREKYEINLDGLTVDELKARIRLAFRYNLEEPIDRDEYDDKTLSQQVKFMEGVNVRVDSALTGQHTEYQCPDDF